MANLNLGPVVDATVSKVIAVASEQLHLVWGWKKDLKKFHLIMKMLRGVLRDADEKHFTGHPHLQGWLEELRAVSDEADDMLEEVAYHNLRCQVAVPKSNWKKVSYLSTPSNHHPLRFRLRMANKVKNLNIHLQDICNWATLMGLQYKFANTSAPMAITSKHTHSFLASIDTTLAIARSKDVNQIVSWLTDESGDQETISVISIVGMPGLGKTSLAKVVCAEVKIGQYFGKNIMWVSVSLNFDVERILGEMLESLRRTPCTLQNTSTLLKEISGELEKNDKNYLLVLDEVWNEESEKWDELRHCLLSIFKKPGNRVLVTTRSEKVASTMGTYSKHMLRLKQLEDNECWPIIKERAFGSTDTTICPELEEIGQRIGKKCGGSPLVVAVIGGTLCNKRDKDEWLSVESKMDALSSLEDQHSRIMHALQLSFDKLPKLALKQCFAFCSIFPRAFVMKKNVLIQLWKAEGFLQPSRENSTEDVGSKYFNDLLSYSLFQVEERDSFGNVESCKMHNLIYDLAKSVSKFETMIFDSGSGRNIHGDESKITISDEVRHLNLIHGVPTNLGDLAPKLCTLFSDHDFPHSMVATKFRRLRVLSFCDASDITQFPTCFANSKSLRYIDISGTQIKKLPRFIMKLYNLQTFRFTKCKSLKMPKGGIKNLVNLEHIDFDDEERMPSNLRRLTSLQTLPLFFVGTTKGRKTEELGTLSGLRGRLEIHKLELVEDKLKAKGAKLYEKAVDDLELRWGEKGNHNKDEEVLEGLQPHTNIRRLSIKGYGGRNLAPWMLKSSDKALALMSLRKLNLSRCPKLESFSVSGLPSLEELYIEDCRVIRSIADGLSSSRGLKILNLIRCPELMSIQSLVSLRTVSILKCNGLERLPSGLTSCTALEELLIRGCSKLYSIAEELKQLPSLVKLEIRECPKLRSSPEEILGSLPSLKRLELGPFSEELEEFPNLSSTSTSSSLGRLSLWGWGKLNLPNLSPTSTSSSIPASLEVLGLYGWGNLNLPHQIQRLTALRDLTISSFNGVEEALLGNLSCLQTLQIIYCTRLRCLSSGLSSLEELEITECPNLVSFQGELKALRSLKVLDCPQLVGFLEKSLGRCTRLKRLVIGRFSEELEEFPSLSSIHASLEDLTLCGWEKLTHLPQIQHLTALKELLIMNFYGLQSLPDWFKNLPSLQRLYLEDCPNELKERCTKGSRPDWHKISHIPCIHINGQTIQFQLQH